MWVHTKNDGWVNLAFVANVRATGKDDRNLLDANGRSLGVVSGHLDMTEWLDADLIPAAAGQEAVVIWVWTDGDAPEVIVEHASIVAWRISRMGAFPVIAGESESPGQSVLILHPDGRVCDPFNCEWPTVEAAKAAFLVDATKAWEEKQGAKTTQAASDSCA